ncbi:hypothetical protein SAMN04487983_10689 [Streptomyces sp. yr375]|nr:hypothetical protein SAMN04487983_10689 [Streptomyces sp. yr375]
MRDLSNYAFPTGPCCRVPRMRSDVTWRTRADTGVARSPLDRVIRSLVAPRWRGGKGSDRAAVRAHVVGRECTLTA